MATISATAATAAVVRTAAVPRASAAAASSPVLGLPQIRMRGGRVKCSARDEKAGVRAEGGAAALAAAAAAGLAAAAAGPALALVDERLSTEGTGLSLGISNNLLGWIIVGVFGLIWALYFVYTSTLEEDEESGGLSL